MKTCKVCGRTHDRLAWPRLPYVGVLEDEPGPWAERHELRNCQCGNTLAVELLDGEGEDDDASSAEVAL